MPAGCEQSPRFLPSLRAKERFVIPVVATAAVIFPSLSIDNAHATPRISTSRVGAVIPADAGDNLRREAEYLKRLGAAGLNVGELVGDTAASLTAAAVTGAPDRASKVLDTIAGKAQDRCDKGAGISYFGKRCVNGQPEGGTTIYIDDGTGGKGNGNSGNGSNGCASGAGLGPDLKPCSDGTSGSAPKKETRKSTTSGSGSGGGSKNLDQARKADTAYCESHPDIKKMRFGNCN